MKNIQYIKKQKGFALLFTILISSIVISIGATIISISIRQTILSTTSRESQYAFYVANTGLECAFYWDTIKGLPAGRKFFPVGNQETLVDLSTISPICAKGNISTGAGFGSSLGEGWIPGGSGNNKTTTFKIVLEDRSSSPVPGAITRCAWVTVTKDLLATDDPATTYDDIGVIKTKIESKGYNTCDRTSPRAVERGIDLEYRN